MPMVETIRFQPYRGNPQLGNLATPINSSGLVKTYINNLPAYRPGLSPFLRGLEIGMAHGYFLVGPEVVVGPLRETAHGANLSGLITAIYIHRLRLPGAFPSLPCPPSRATPRSLQLPLPRPPPPPPQQRRLVSNSAAASSSAPWAAQSSPMYCWRTSMS